MRLKTSIGDVLIHHGEPPDGNPYRGWGRIAGEPVTCLAGNGRAPALAAFRDGHDTGDLTFWHGPTNGGARRITDPDDINWKGMRQ